MTTLVTSKINYDLENRKLFRHQCDESLDAFLTRKHLSYNPENFYNQMQWVRSFFYKRNGRNDTLSYMMRRRTSGKDDISVNKTNIYDTLYNKFGGTLEDVLMTEKLLMLIPNTVAQTYDPSTSDMLVVDQDTYSQYSNTYVPPTLEPTDATEEMPELFKQYLDRLIPPNEMCWYRSSPENKFSQQEYVVKWLSQRVQYPAKDPTVALVLTGEQGTGKSFLFDIIMRPLVGEHNYLTTNLKAVTGRFNKSIFFKTLIHIEEVDDNRTKTLDRLKEITKKHHDVEEKFLNRKQVTKYFGYVVTSNKVHPIKVELSDRRHFFTSYSKVATDTPAFMHKFASWLENDNGLQQVLNYLYFVDISNFDIRDCPMSETKQSLMEQETYTEQGVDKARLMLSENQDFLYKPRDIADAFKISIVQAQQVLKEQGYEPKEARRWNKGQPPFVAWSHSSYKPKYDSHRLWDSREKHLHFGTQKNDIPFDDDIEVITGENQELNSPSKITHLWS